MQPIERYGVAALLFLIVTVGAVVLWDQSEAKGPADAVGQDSGNVKVQLGGNVLASLDQNSKSSTPANTRREGRRPSAEPTLKGASADTGKGGAQAGGASLTNNDDWARGTKTDLRIPLEDIKKKHQAEQDAALALLAATEKEIATSFEPQGKKIGTGGLLRVHDAPTPSPSQDLPGKSDSKPASKTTKYKVVSGDTLGQIAIDQLGRYKHLGELLKANPGLSADTPLYVGKELLIPDLGPENRAATVAKAPFQKSATPTPKAGSTYTVREGDSLWSIAASQLGNGSRNPEIRAANPALKGDTLAVGMVLTLPTGGATAKDSVASVAKRSEPATAPQKPRFKPGVVR